MLGEKSHAQFMKKCTCVDNKITSLPKVIARFRSCRRQTRVILYCKILVDLRGEHTFGKYRDPPSYSPDPRRSLASWIMAVSSARASFSSFNSFATTT